LALDLFDCIRTYLQKGFVKTNYYYSNANNYKAKCVYKMIANNNNIVIFAQ